MSDKPRVIFILTTGAEVRAVSPIYRELVSRGSVDVINLCTGSLCCDQDSELPKTALQQLEIPFVSQLAYASNAAIELRCEQPDLVVVGSDQEYIRRSFVYAAEGLGIPALMLHLGISSNTWNTPSMATKRTIHRLRSYGLNIARKYAYLLKTVVATKWSLWRIIKMVVRDVAVAFTASDVSGAFSNCAVAVSSPYEKRTLVTRGVAADRITVVGNPMISYARVTTDIRNQLSIPKEDKVILFLTCAQVEHGLWTKAMRDRFVRGVVDSLAPLLVGSVHLVIKIHPVESLAAYTVVVGDGDPRVTVHKSLPLADTIQASDLVVVGGYSTTVLEAGALCKPVLLLNVLGEVEGLDYQDMGLVVELSSLDDLLATADELLYDLSAREKVLDKAKLFFQSNKELVDNGAVGRASDLIVKLAGGYRE